MFEAVKRHIPRGTEELNVRAFKAGCALVREKETAAP
jgi:Pyruvate/2-oxoacid:ferredoxin oxidoreductase gamma subunit